MRLSPPDLYIIHVKNADITISKWTQIVDRCSWQYQHAIYYWGIIAIQTLIKMMTEYCLTTPGYTLYTNIKTDYILVLRIFVVLTV